MSYKWIVHEHNVFMACNTIKSQIISHVKTTKLPIDIWSLGTVKLLASMCPWAFIYKIGKIGDEAFF